MEGSQISCPFLLSLPGLQAIPFSSQKDPGIVAEYWWECPTAPVEAPSPSFRNPLVPPKQMWKLRVIQCVGGLGGALHRDSGVTKLGL